MLPDYTLYKKGDFINVQPVVTKIMTSFTENWLPLVQGETLDGIIDEFEAAPDFHEHLLNTIEEIGRENPGIGFFLANGYLHDPFAAYWGTLIYLSLRAEMAEAWKNPE